MSCIALIVFFGVWQLASPQVPVTRILVAKFDGPGAYRVTEILLEKLRGATSEYGDVSIEVIGPITAEQGSSYARTLGNKENAAVVIWGWYDVTATTAVVTTHFETINPKPLPSADSGRQSRLPAEELQNFSFQIELSRDAAGLVLFAAGLARYDSSDFVGAIARFNDSINQSPSPKWTSKEGISYAYYFRGNALLHLDRVDEAIKDFDMALQLRPEFVEAYVNRSVAYYRKGDCNRAIEDLDKVVDSPLRAFVLNNRGICRRILNDLDGAVSDFTEAIRLKPGDGSLYNNLGNTLDQMRNWDGAISAFTKAIQLEANYAEAYHNRGNALDEKGDQEAALKDYSKALQIDPNLGECYLLRADIYLSRQDRESARKDVDTTIGLRPRIPPGSVFWKVRALLRFKLRQFVPAIADYSKAIEVDAKDCCSFEGRADAYRHLQRCDMALPDYGRAIALKPSKGAYVNRAACFTVLREYSTAASDLNAALDLDPEFVEARLGLIGIYFRLGDPAKAIAACNRAVELAPKNAKVHNSCGAAYVLAGDRRRVLDSFHRVLALNNDSVASQQARENLRGMGDLRHAVGSPF